MTKENETMENRGNGGDTMGTYGRKGAKLHTKGFTLIASLLMLLLLSGIAIGLMMMVNTEGKVGATDLQSNLAYHAAEGGIEKMYSDLSAVFQAAQSPSATAICSVDNNPPTMVGVTWKDYSVTSQGLTCPASSTATVTSNWGSVQSGPNAGLYAQIIPVNMLVTADLTTGGQEVSMTRQAQVALIPVFQFGMFCDGDCSIFPGSDMVFAGPVHANGDFYPFVNGGANLTFQSKVSVFGNIVRTLLPNTNAASIKKTGNVYVPTSNSATACSITTPGNPPSTAAGNSCVQLDAVTSATYGDGSVTGMGTGAAQPAANYYSAFNTWSNGTTHDQFINNNYYVTGLNTPPGTGANKLSLPFVNGTNFPYEIIRRPPAGESATSQLGQSREYNMAQIHVLLSDDPADLPGGATDKNNVRLANVTQTTGNTVVTPWGVTISAANYVPATFGTPAAGTYNLYFATASNSVPIPVNCVGTTCPSDDWSLPPVQWTAAMAAADGITYAAPVPANAPIYWNNGPAPTVNLCPPTGVIATSTPAPSLNCATSTVPTPTATTTNTWTTTYPYYAVPNPALPVEGGALTTYNQIYSTGPTTTAGSDSWGLIDGWLRVEYVDKSSGLWVGVTNEWLQLGFARGVTAPTATSPNPINPNAILLLQEPADRSTTSTLATICTSTSCPAGSLTATSTGITATPNATAPVCNSWNTGHTICLTWTPGVPPQLAADTLLLAEGSKTVPVGATGTSGDWAFGLTPAAPTATTPQSITMYNWYPINFYDAREGEPRDIDWSTVNGAAENSCTTNGVMNAVEIDVGNLQNWLNGTTPGSGQNVNSSAQNGYILYFSDRRGMLPNPNLTSSHPANTKSGDSGLEDTINSASIVGTPNNTLETKMTGKTFSPEDDNQNGVLDNWGAYNLGLGFYGTVLPVNNTTNLNTKIVSTNPAPNPYGTVAANGGDRINSCGRTGRKNWVSGARHVLKLVDGSLGNVPLMPAPVVYNSVNYWGGFTVASENPVYIQGDYNSAPPPTDTTWSTGKDVAGMAAAAVIADAVTLLSNNWDDRVSMVGLPGTTTSPTDITNRVAKTTYYRLAIAAGKNMTFTNPAAWPETGAPDNEDDIGTDGGIHNFLHLLENWGNGPVEYYKGSLASLYYSTYNTGFYKCCTAVYGVPTRNFSFDLDFSVPAGLPPGTPMFRDVESLGYRQLFATRLANQ